MAPCKFFAQGRCTFGASCKNSHEAAKSPMITNGPNLRLEESKTPCWYFSQGKCTYGASCRNSHDTLDQRSHLEQMNSSLNSNVSDRIFRPKLSASEFLPTVTTPVVRSAGPTICVFFASGYCRNGETCPFLHVTSEAPHKAEPILEMISHDSRIEKLTESFSTTTISSTFTENIHGATVSFDTSGKVTDVKLISDYSAIQISGLTNNTTIADVQRILRILEFEVSASCITLKPLGSIGTVAEMKVEDPTFAKVVTKTFEFHQEISHEFRNMSIKVLTSSAKHGPLDNRLQLSTVTCTWYHASRAAWLSYNSQAKAETAQALFRSIKVLGRTLECTIQVHTFSRYRRPPITVQLGNLHPRTSNQDLESILSGYLEPASIKIGAASHMLSDQEESGVVEKLLRRKGGLQSFQLHPTSSSKAKATAIFADRETATEAVQTLNNTRIRILGNSKLFVGHVLAVKYNVLTVIAKALEKDIDILRRTSLESGYVHIKTYPQTDPLKPFVSIRISGENSKNVASTKRALEKLLVGKIVMDGDTKLWDSFFAQPSCLPYLNELSANHQLYIYRDARKAQLSVFGGSPSSIKDIQAAIMTKLADLRQLTHRISLTSILLQRAMNGGMRRLKKRFGDKVTLQISSNPKTIFINGSAADFHEAQLILSTLDERSDNQLTTESEDCAVCWTEVTDPLTTRCSHNYCKDCFAAQVSAANLADLPITCCGGGGDCGHTFNTDELKAMLSFTAYEDFLQSSFNDYIHTRPNEFQHCPTPDCTQIYRRSHQSQGDIFLCSACLSPVCTTCNVISHDGMSCEEFKDISSEGTKAFQKWKEENDVRSCPNCKVDIEKIDGCNHMSCEQCGTHICWFCMDTFDAGEKCYSHMRLNHGSFYENA